MSLRRRHRRPDRLARMVAEPPPVERRRIHVASGERPHPDLVERLEAAGWKYACSASAGWAEGMGVDFWFERPARPPVPIRRRK